MRELRNSGHVAYDADDDGFSEPRDDGRWGWRAEMVADLLTQDRSGALFFAGCSEEQTWLPFDVRVLLTAPAAVLVERLIARTGNSYGRDAAERAQVLDDSARIEPVLRRSADLVLDTTAPPEAVAQVLLTHLRDDRDSV